MTWVLLLVGLLLLSFASFAALMLRTRNATLSAIVVATAWVLAGAIVVLVSAVVVVAGVVINGQVSP
jgi:hypothetical protein